MNTKLLPLKLLYILEKNSHERNSKIHFRPERIHIVWILKAVTKFDFKFKELKIKERECIGP